MKLDNYTTLRVAFDVKTHCIVSRVQLSCICSTCDNNLNISLLPLNQGPVSSSIKHWPKEWINNLNSKFSQVSMLTQRMNQRLDSCVFRNRRVVKVKACIMHWWSRRQRIHSRKLKVSQAFKVLTTSNICFTSAWVTLKLWSDRYLN